MSDMLYLQKDQVYTTMLSSTTAGHLNGISTEGGYSIYFANSFKDVTGIYQFIILQFPYVCFIVCVFYLICDM